jgi:murein DD-endopeptidase MepM/ murein hydrolase activator NlpD
MNKYTLNILLALVFFGLIIFSPILKSSGFINPPQDPASTYGPTAPEWKISSAFGPRSLESSPFHAGIDYNRQKDDEDFGFIIKALSDGIIEQINRKSSGYFISIRSEFGTLQYLHIFRNSNASEIAVSNTSGGLYSKVVLRPILNILSEMNQPQLVECNSIVFHNPNGTINKILTTTQCDGAYIPDPITKALIKASSIVKADDDIAPLGNSGHAGTKSHLHLGLNHRKNNPLWIIKHDDSQNYKVSLSTEDGPFEIYDNEVLKKMTKPGFVIKVEDNNLRPELDRIIVMNPDGKGGTLTEFSFGGSDLNKIINAEAININPNPNLDLRKGAEIPTIKPLEWDESGTPRIMYFFVPYPDIRSLKSGEHFLDVFTPPLNGESNPATKLTFKIDLAVVNSVEFSSTLEHQEMNIIVKGEGLGAWGDLVLELNDCCNRRAIGGTDTYQVFSCVPIRSGQFNGFIKTRVTNRKLHEFTVNVGDTTDKKYNIDCS